MFNLETALSTWRHQYKYSRSFKGRDLDELEQHLRDQVSFLVSGGAEEEEAFRTAVEELGAYHETETDYRSVAWMKTRDRKEVMREISFFLTMMANYLRVAFRNLKKNKVSSAINILGLSVSIAVALVTYLFVSTVMNQDAFHENSDEIFLVHQVTQEEDGVMWWGNTPMPLGKEIVQSIPAAERVVRLAQSTGNVSYGDADIRASFRFVDPEFMDMFTFPLEAGTYSALTNPDQVILSYSNAERFFGMEDPLGKVLRVRIGDGDPAELTVTGVTKEFPAAADIQFSILMGYDALRLAGEIDSENWATFTAATFVQLRNAADEALVESQLNEAYIDRVNAPDLDWQVTGFELDNLQNLTHNSQNVSRTISGSISMAPVFVLSLISGLLLLLSCFNYMNITIATASRRLKEIGVRKAVGGSRKQLVFQFLAENVELCAMSLVLGLWMAWQFILPGFNAIADVNFEIGLLESWEIWVFLIALVFVTGLASGAYPALYVSGFRPTIIFQGRERLGRRRPLTHGFLTFQFMLAFMTLASGIVLTLNGRYHTNRDWGYEGEHILFFEAFNPAELNVIHTSALQAPGVLDISLSRDAVGYNDQDVDLIIDGKEIEAIEFGVSKGYASVLGIELSAGTLLDDETVRSGTESILVNETFVAEAGWEDPVGQFVNLDSTSYAVAGVMKDFHYNDFFSIIQPVLFKLTPETDNRFVTLRLQEGAGVATSGFIDEQLTAVFPDKQARFFFQDAGFQAFYEESMGISSIFIFVATIALMISCLSIYALSSQNVVNRLKEIGVRKVLGGSSSSIARLVNRKLLIILTLAAVLSSPLAFIGLDALLDDIYAYRMPLNALPFIITYLVILGTTLLTISTQVRSINRARPADIMRSE